MPPQNSTASVFPRRETWGNCCLLVELVSETETKENQQFKHAKTGNKEKEKEKQKEKQKDEKKKTITTKN